MPNYEYEVFYRDGSNYKYTAKAYSNIDCKVGEEVTTDGLIEMTGREFVEEILGLNYDDECDHNIVEITGKTEINNK